MGESIRQFEDIIAWQKARELTKRIYSLTGSNAFRHDFGLADQIQRAAVSIMANVAEGFERRGPREFYHFLGIAKPSCAEVSSHLYVALDIGYLTQSEFDDMNARVKEIGKILGGFRASVGRARNSELGTRHS